ncbi:MAG: pyrroline-5-carboxylate reductase [Pontimonas sp.]
MSHTLPSIALIGTGKMGGAILEGLRQPDVSVESLRATTQSEAASKLWREKGVDARSLESDAAANQWAVDGAHLVVLAVKPHYILDVARTIAPALAPDAVVVSVAAGITTADIEAATHRPVVRAMPNTPTQIRQGVTGVASGATTSSDQLSSAVGLFELVGDVVIVDESDINVLSALSGSGPAYLFYVAEKMMDVATHHGFSPEQARTMVQGTLLGAAALLEASGETPQDLRRAVTSPGGTTEQAIAVFDEHRLGEVFFEAVDRAVARAIEMSKKSD